MKKRGRFIVFEGSDGSGKTTMVQRMAQHMTPTDGSPPPVVTREPGGTPFGEHARSLLLERPYELATTTEVLVFLAGRAQHIHQVITPHLEAGRDVVCDRFNWSTMAYQGFGRNLDRFALANAVDFTCGDVRPDIIVWMDLDPVIGLERIRKRQIEKGIETDHFQDLGAQFHYRVQQGYEFCYQTNFSRPRKIVRVNANQPLELVWKVVAESVGH